MFYCAEENWLPCKRILKLILTAHSSIEDFAKTVFLNTAETFLLKSNIQYCKMLCNTEINF